MSTPVAPEPSLVADRLAGLLAARFGGPVTITAEPGRLSGGFDFWIYAVQFSGTGLPAEWATPLVARIPPTPERFPSLERETRLQSWVATAGYPTPAVLELVAPGQLFDSPVQVVQRVPGRPMMASMTGGPWRIPRLAASLGTLQADLHSLALPGWAGTERWSVLDQRLSLVHVLLDRVSRPDVAAALDRVEALRPTLEAAPAVICHGDFHPLNVLVEGRRASVIDWTDAAFGDRHCDVARTSWLFGFAAAAAPRRAERALVRSIAPLLRRRYLASYGALNEQRVRLWIPVHVLHAWAMTVSDELELFGPSRAGSEFGRDLATWAAREFETTMAAV